MWPGDFSNLYVYNRDRNFKGAAIRIKKNIVKIINPDMAFPPFLLNN